MSGFPHAWMARTLAAASLMVAFDALATSEALSPDTGWLSFDVDNTVNAVATPSSSWTDQASYNGDGSLLDFTVTLSQAATLNVADLGYAGDTFAIYDNGVLIGNTGAVAASPSGPSATVYTLGQADQAFADPTFSSGSFALGTGKHDITGKLIQSAVDSSGAAFNATQGAVELTSAVPEPSSWALMGVGLLTLVTIARRRGRTPARRGAIAAVLAAAGLINGSAEAATVTARVIAFNDFHGNLQSPGKFDGKASGGADYLAAYIATLKAANPNNIVVHAGDMVGASPLISGFFHDEGTIEVMNQIGIDLSSVGNHEFDAGKQELLRKQQGGSCFPSVSGGSNNPSWTAGVNSCEGGNPNNPVPDVGTVFQGAKFKYLAANVIDESTGAPLFPAYYIKTFGGVRVAFIGMTLRTTPSIVTPTGVAGLQFNDEADTVNALIPKLRARGVNAIIVVIHQGGAQGAAPNDLNNCSESNTGTTADSMYPIKEILARTYDGVDMVISGHSHVAYNCTPTNAGAATDNTGFPNINGHLIPVTQASSYGRILTTVDLSLDSVTGKITGINSNNVIVDETNPTIKSLVTTSPAANIQKIQAIVGGYNTLVSGLTSQIVGMVTADVPSAPNPSTCEKVAGDMIADGQLEATAPPSLGGAQIGFINAGGVRGSGFSYTATPPTPNGDITYGSAFTLQPFGNSLVTLTLTAQNLHDALEQQFSGCLGQTNGTNRVMDPSYTLNYTFDASQACGSRIRSAALVDSSGTITDQIVQNGVVLNPAKTYRVNVNNFLAAGGDNFSTFLQGTAQLGGAQDIDALVAYLANFNAPNPPLNPASIKPRITRLDSAPGALFAACQ